MKSKIEVSKMPDSIVKVEVIPFKNFKDRISIMKRLRNNRRVTIEEGYMIVEY